jgi:hypothetical protein
LRGQVRVRFAVLVFPGPGFPRLARLTQSPTKLESFLLTRELHPAHIAQESGYSRQHLLRVRMGKMDATGKCMKAVTLACRRLSQEPVTALHLFDLGGFA